MAKKKSAPKKAKSAKPEKKKAAPARHAKAAAKKAAPTRAKKVLSKAKEILKAIVKPERVGKPEKGTKPEKATKGVLVAHKETAKKEMPKKAGPVGKAPPSTKAAAPAKAVEPVEKAPAGKKAKEGKKAAKEVVPTPSEMAAAEAEVILTNADGKRYCKVGECDELATSDSYCRYHYLLNWKKIQLRKKILAGDKLNRYIEELTARYPDKYLEMIRKDLATDKDFLAALQELEIDEGAEDYESDDDSKSYVDEIRGVAGGGGAAPGGDDDDY